MGILKSRVAAVATGSLIVVGLGAGGAVAADMVTSNEIRNQTIGSADIGRNAVRGWELDHDSTFSFHVKNGSLKNRDFSPWVQNRLQEAGDAGPAGPAGPQGEAGADGQDGVSGLETDGFYTRNDGTGLGPAIEVGASRQLRSECAEGKYALSGGFSNGNTVPGTDLTIRESHPSGFEVIEGDAEGSVRPTAWSVTVENETDQVQHAQVFVTCAAIADTE